MVDPWPTARNSELCRSAQPPDELDHGPPDGSEALARQPAEPVAKIVPGIAPVDQVDRGHAAAEERRVVVDDRGLGAVREVALGSGGIRRPAQLSPRRLVGAPLARQPKSLVP